MSIPCPKCGRPFAWDGTRCSRRDCRYGGTEQPVVNEGFGVTFYADPAAIAALDSAAAAEYARVTALIYRDEDEMWADLIQLVKLLHRVGCTREADSLLRANLLVRESGRAIYVELFGTAKQDEFSTVIDAFAAQFFAELEPAGSHGLFYRWYLTKPQHNCLRQYRLRDEPCSVVFNYDGNSAAGDDYFQAEIQSLKLDDQLIFLRWIKGSWEIVGTAMSCLVSDDGND